MRLRNQTKRVWRFGEEVAKDGRIAVDVDPPSDTKDG